MSVARPTCDEVRDAAFDARRGDLGEATAALHAEHVATCAGCEAFVRSLDALLRASGAALPAARVEAVWRGIARALPGTDEVERPARTRRRAIAAGALTLCAAAALVWVGAALSSEAPATPPRAAKALAAWSALDAPAPPRPTTATRPAHLPEGLPLLAWPDSAALVAPIAATPRATPPRPRSDARDARELDALQRDARWSEAAALLERRARAAAADPTLHLELARLYARRLGGPRRAAEHLRRFLAVAPDDPTAPSAFRELCRLAARARVSEPLCPTAVAHER